MVAKDLGVKMHHNEDGRALTRLIEERLPGKRYGVFFATGEGRFFEDGTEESSGSVVTEDDDHYDYWTGWDADAGRATFVRWQPIEGCEEHGGWRGDQEYRDARRAAGL